MSSLGNSYDNAAAENFFSGLNCELVHHKHYRTRAEAQADLFSYIEAYYNAVRPQSALHWLSPLSYGHLLSVYGRCVAWQWADDMIGLSLAAARCSAALFYRQKWFHHFRHKHRNIIENSCTLNFSGRHNCRPSALLFKQSLPDIFRKIDCIDTAKPFMSGIKRNHIPASVPARMQVAAHVGCGAGHRIEIAD